MIQTKTIAMIALIAVVTLGLIGTAEMLVQHVLAASQQSHLSGDSSINDTHQGNPKTKKEDV